MIESLRNTKNVKSIESDPIDSLVPKSVRSGLGVTKKGNLPDAGDVAGVVAGEVAGSITDE